VEQEDQAWQRLDKFLVFARFNKTRSEAGAAIAAGRVRINRLATDKPHFKIRPGDVLTLTLPRGVRVVRVRALARRRGPASEAAGLIEEIGEAG
jgi:ribosome-associated heat shock protein Hsp15